MLFKITLLEYLAMVGMKIYLLKIVPMLITLDGINRNGIIYKLK